MSLPDIGSDLPDVALRTAVIYVVLVVLLRVGGKREIGQLSIFELVVLLVISDAVQNSMVGSNSTLWGGIVAAVVLFGLDRALRVVTDRSRAVRNVLEGEPSLLVRNGRECREAMRREGIDHDELHAALRAHGIANIADVRLAVLEIDGSISVIPRQGRRTAARSARLP